MKLLTAGAKALVLKQTDLFQQGCIFFLQLLVIEFQRGFLIAQAGIFLHQLQNLRVVRLKSVSGGFNTLFHKAYYTLFSQGNPYKIELYCKVLCGFKRAIS